MREKIFVIGFNKCGTASLHGLFRESGIQSTKAGPNDPSKNKAFKILVNFNLRRPILDGMDEFEAYSDIIFITDQFYIEGMRFYLEIYKEYPDAYYILNYRNVDNWLKSRFNHNEKTFVTRTCNVLGCDADTLKELWREQFLRHNREVEDFFAGKPRFLKFDIETDDIQVIKDFLAPEYEIDLSEWKNRNKTRAR